MNSTHILHVASSIPDPQELYKKGPTELPIELLVKSVILLNELFIDCEERHGTNMFNDSGNGDL